MEAKYLNKHVFRGSSEQIGQCFQPKLAPRHVFLAFVARKYFFHVFAALECFVSRSSKGNDQMEEGRPRRSPPHPTLALLATPLASALARSRPPSSSMRGPCSAA
jgi:hypothetical protein